ncbi:wd repeat-containing protein 1 [Stylonychia lemnae]|uniref:Wd repeat-containing protein 1 n=1 Tax=Stylonychia lemnae TaxID=5949 RepID=A0A077ZP81_STYLE|nr:wd repeat-containing protein 1 [Stylonychia lemnae]|eukprot:CDW71723.1 wd repeat-containing protein 1 [Stylonychia lemnae]
MYAVYTDFLSKVSCVKYSPNGAFIASGDSTGKVRIWSYSEESKEFVVKKEHGMLGGAVHAISFTDDGQRICAAGEGKDMYAKAVLVDSGSKIGDIFGPTAAITSIDIKKKPYRLVMGGENQELFVYDGVPFKAVKTLYPHSNFVNKVVFSPEGKKFVSASSDKSLVIHDTETLEEIKKIEKAHNKGVTDVVWIDEDTLMTSSTDNTIKIWSAEDGSEIKVLSIDGDEQEKLENQQLGIIAESENFWSVTLNSNINIYNGKDVFKKDLLTPSKIIQGHSNYISCMTLAKTTLISADQDGKIFSWSNEIEADLFHGEGHSMTVSILISADDVVYSFSTDGLLKRSERLGDSHSFEFKNQVKLEGSPVAAHLGQDFRIYVLLNNNKVQILSADLSESQTNEITNYEPTALAQAGVELWVGDKKGLIHCLSIADLSEQSLIEKKHNHSVSVMKASRDGQLVASGDSYRYIYVFSAETKAEVACFTYHTAKILTLDFNRDSSMLLTSSLDLGVGVARIAEKTKKVLHRTNEKELTGAVFDHLDRFFTSGYDCSIRLWSQ